MVPPAQRRPAPALLLVLAALVAAVSVAWWLAGGEDRRRGVAARTPAPPGLPAAEAPDRELVAVREGPEPTPRGRGGTPEPDADRRGLGVARVHGRCVDPADDRPLAGVRVILVVHDREPQERTTDAAGAFEFPSPGNTVSWIELPRPSAWLAERPRHRLSPAERFGEQEVLFELESAHTFRGRVLDERTGEPVGDVFVELSEEQGYQDRVRTDASGWFTSERHLRRRTVSARVEDRTALRVSGGRRLPANLLRLESLGPYVTHWDPERDPTIELRVRIGPTFRLAFEAPEPVDPAAVGLRIVEVSEHEVRASNWSPARRDGLPWVRFRDPFERAPGSELWLQARAARQDLVARAPIDSAEGRVAGVVRLPLVPATDATLGVVDASGAPVEGARVVLTPWSEARDGFQPRRRAVFESDGRGGVRATDVPVGRHRLEVLAGALPALEQEVLLGPGRTDLGSVQLAEPVAGRLAGRLLFLPTEDRPLPAAHLEWFPEDRSERARLLRLVPTSDEGEWTFDSGPLPAGRCTIRLVPNEGDWAPLRWDGSPPATDLVFRQLR